MAVANRHDETVLDSDVMATLELATARLEQALDALQALLGGLTIVQKGKPDVVYAKVIDDREMQSAEQLRSLHFARGVLVENGR